MSLPADSIKSLAGFRIIRVKDNKVLKEAKTVAGEHPLLAGKYKVVLLFAQPNYRKPDEALLGEYEIKGGEVTEVALGAVAINIAGELTKAVEGVSLVDQKSGWPFITHISKDNDYYLFKTRQSRRAPTPCACTTAAAPSPPWWPIMSRCRRARWPPPRLTAASP